MRDQCRWFGGMVGNHVADIVARYGARLGRVADRPLTDYIAGRAGLRLQRARPRGQHARRVRARRDRRPVLPPRHRRRSTSSGSRRCAALGVDQFAGLPPARRQGGDAARLRRARHPRAGDPGRGHRMTDLATTLAPDAHRAGAPSGRASGRRRAAGPRRRARGPPARRAVGAGTRSSCPTTGGHLGEARVLPRTDDLAMPHVWDIVDRGAPAGDVGAPARRPCWQRGALGVLVHAAGRARGLAGRVVGRAAARRAHAALAAGASPRCCRGWC